MLMCLILLAPVPTSAVHAASHSTSLDPAAPIPVMAYYYIWYDEKSWDRAKVDYPVLGRYSSDDRAVMEQHVRWAKEAGIKGFIVSWKSTFKLDRRLEQLMDVAAEQDFYLWIIYQGLDFERDPLPVEQIEADLAYFDEQYADHPVFALLERPVVLLSGTWEFTPAQISRLTAPYRDTLTILATERNLPGYERLADLVDGNAYYWSSVNPKTYRGYQAKLDAFSQAIHQNGGLWIAPAAPGFDARLIGGTSVVEREDGQTLRTQLDTAMRSAPDAIGLISWNEFSENSHVEPSLKYGARYLDVLTDRDRALPPQIVDFDSSAPGTTLVGASYPLSILLSVGLLVVSSIAVIARRQYRQTKDFAE
jgi:hypothetical protein